ncbi:hypothetical protein KP509_23G059300 [Ceratopteris richardii]|uniref:Uncharacterized protein n=1 Tax=Ceratopteris richardii TaxID=49495 RepID=A0A8T2S085_CERRI|nr:hypothetical protein KP509_23G059300 [Ceratopteris richardii]
MDLCMNIDAATHILNKVCLSISTQTDHISTQTCPISTQTNLIAITVEEKVSVSTQTNLVLVFTLKGNQEPKQILGKSKKQKRLDPVIMEPKFIEIERDTPKIQHGVIEEKIQELKPIHKDLQLRALILEAFPDSNAFLQWCLEHFNVWIWSAYDLYELNKCIDTIFLEFRRKFTDIWGRDQCFWKFSIHFKKQAHFWDKNVEYRPNNTLIIDSTSYMLFYNIRRCCVTLPQMTISERINYLSGTLCDQLWKWLIAPNRIEYSDIISRLIPLDEESLSKYHGIH